MLATLFLTSQSPSSTLQFHSFCPVSSLNPKRSNPRILKLIKTPEISLLPPDASTIKVPTAPWMRSPSPLQPHEVINNPWEPTTDKQVEKADRALTDKESGVRGNKAMKRIIRNIEKLQENGVSENSQKSLKPFELRECFEKIGGVGGGGEEKVEVFGWKMPWSKDERIVFRRMKKEKVERRADAVLDKGLLERLRVQARKMRKWVKVMKAGVTDNVVYEVRLAWRRSELAMLKFEVPLCRNMERAREIVECLTGGVLLLRNKYFVILYRGKDFLPCGVENLIAEREKELKRCQLQEESARLKATETFSVPEEPLESTGETGTLSEFLDIQTEFGDPKKGNREFELQLEADKENLKRELRMQERKLFILNMKIKNSAEKLSKLNSTWRPSELDADQELITDEERECFRKIGLKMNSNLLLGRRGVFDGVIEGVHQHWKHREVVKVITMQRLFVQVLYTAKWLVAESGGILVSVEKLKEGHAIIIYRGKNYRRPVKLKIGNLLTKRKALQRSLEMQRLGSLKFFAYQRQRVISDLKLKQADLQDSKEKNMKITELTDVPCSDDTS